MKIQELTEIFIYNSWLAKNTSNGYMQNLIARYYVNKAKKYLFNYNKNKKIMGFFKENNFFNDKLQ